MKNVKCQNTITLKIEGAEITAETFSRCTKTFFGLINEVAANISGKRKGVKWIISVVPGSIGLCATAVPINGEISMVNKTVNAIHRGICQISRNEKRPVHFSDNALENIYELGTIVGLGGQGINSIKIGFKNKWNDISPSSVCYVDNLLGAKTRAYGTVEGQLLALELSGRLNFGIDETLTGRRIKCFFGDNIYTDVIKSLKQRVAAYGLISYQRNGEPKNIEIEHLRVFPPDSKLPKFKDIIGLYSD
jgi:hypothetical protein